MGMECLKVFRCIDQDNDHSGAVFLHQIIQFVLDSISESCRMLDDQVFSCQHIGYRADSSFI